MRPSRGSFFLRTNPRPSSVVTTPVAVGRLMPTACANSRDSISPQTHSTHRPMKAVHDSRSAARTFASMCRRIAADARKRFETAHIARKSSGRSPSASSTLRSAGSSSSVTPEPPPRSAHPARGRRRRSRHVVFGRAEVDEARPQPHPTVDERRGKVHAPVRLDRLGERVVVRVEVGDARRHMADRHDRELRRLGHRLEVFGAAARRAVEQVGLAEVLRDRLAELRRAVRPEGEPELQRAERPRVLERDIHGVQLVLLVGQVPLLVREGASERRRAPAPGRPRMPWAGRATCARRPTPSRLARAREEACACVGPKPPASRRPRRTWSHTPRSAQTSAIASIGSIAPVRVVPAVADDRDRGDAGRHVAVDRLRPARPAATVATRRSAGRGGCSNRSPAARPRG